jgi:hypothetical protein
MSNILDNGTVLPHGLLSGSSSSMGDAFKKTYQNSSLRVGIVTQSYSVADPKNITKIFPEYDVMTFEQNEDQGSTTITYKNCIAASSFGSIADFFEANIRKLKVKKTKGVTPSPAGQDGSIVLLLCLNGLSDKGVIVGCLSHPDRKTNLKDSEPYLEGEYNGVNIKVGKDGSTSITFKGATDNQGKPVDASQGNTEIKIEKDGSYQVDHDSISFRMDRNGTTTLKGKKDINLITDTNVNVTATKDVNVKCVNAKVDASGKVNVNSGGDTTVVAGADCKVTATGKIVETAKEIDLNGAISGITTENSHQGVIDFITGVPVQPSQTVKADV